MIQTMGQILGEISDDVRENVRRLTMDIKQHKALISQIPEDLVEGEEIEVLVEEDEWRKVVFSKWHIGRFCACLMDRSGDVWRYARRPVIMLSNDKENAKMKIFPVQEA